MARAASSSVLVVLLAVGVAHADPEMTADKEFTRGRELMKDKKYDEACQAFEHSQRLDPQFGTVFNLADCDTLNGKLATAWNLYRELAHADTNAGRRAEAQTRATALAARVPKLVVTARAHPEGLVITVDGADVTSLLGIENPLDAGTYTIVSKAPGFRPYTTKVELTEGELATAAIVLDPVDAGEDPTAPVMPSVVRASSRRRRAGELGTLGGLAVTAIGLGFGAYAYVEAHGCDDCSDTQLATRSHRAVILGDVSTVVTAVGVVSLVAGAYLWRTAHHGGVVVAPQVGGHEAGLAIAGRFW